MARIDALPVEVRRAHALEHPAVSKFYEATGYAPAVASGDDVTVALRDGQIVGVCRITTEEGHAVLRGMRVAESYWRRGIATSLLRVVEATLAQPCYCLPYSHLVALYARARFAPVEEDQLPPFLLARLSRYRAKGELITAMLRPLA